MLGWLRRKRAISDAARVMGKRAAQTRAERERQAVRDMANRLRADMTAKGRTDLPQIDWSKL